MTEFKPGDGVVVKTYIARHYAKVADIKFDKDIRIDRLIDGIDLFPLSRVFPAPPVKVGDWVKIHGNDHEIWTGIRQVTRAYSDGKITVKSSKDHHNEIYDGLFKVGEYEPVYDYEPEKSVSAAMADHVAASALSKWRVPSGQIKAVDDMAQSPFIRTVTRREIVPGVYGMVTLYYVGNSLRSEFTKSDGSAEELREAAHLLNQIAEVLEENAT